MAAHHGKALLLKKAVSPEPKTFIPALALPRTHLSSMSSYPHAMTFWATPSLLFCFFFPFSFVKLSEIPMSTSGVQEMGVYQKRTRSNRVKVGNQGWMTSTYPMGNLPLPLTHLAAIEANPGFLAICEHLP